MKNTRKLLVSSLIMILSCCLLFAGTTFAWFSDSVTSGNNVITAGNLDVEVEYTLDGKTWANLNGAADLFQKSRWEPGHTKVVVLKVKNEGSLALKYSSQFKITGEVIGKTKKGEDIKLSEILKLSSLLFADAGVDPFLGINFAERTIEEAFKGEDNILYSEPVAFGQVNKLADEEKLMPGEVHYIAIKVDMPETVGNEANHDGVNVPSVSVAIDVFATQVNSEIDSFGPDYDAGLEVDENGILVTLSDGSDVFYFNETSGYAGKVRLMALPENLANEYVVPSVVNDLGGALVGVTLDKLTITKNVKNAYKSLERTTIGEVVIEDGATVIPNRMFYNANVKNFVIPESVIIIEENAFAQAKGVEELVIPASVTTTEEAAFQHMEALNKVTFKGNTAIQGYAFRGCAQLRTVVLKGEDTTFIPSTLSGKNLCWFCNGESNNPNTSDITFHVENDVVAERVIKAMGAEANNTKIYIDGNLVTNSVEEIKTVLETGGSVLLSSDVTAPLSGKAIYGTPVAIQQKNGGIIDGNGNSLHIENPQYEGYAIETYGGTIKNLTITTAVGRGIMISSPKEDIYIEKVVVDGPGYAINTTEHNGKKLIVTESTIKGWTSLAGLESASFANCSFGENSSKYWQNNGYSQDYDRLIRPYVKATFTDCTFEEGCYLDLSALGADCTITLTNCVVNSVKLTADNYMDYITIELPNGRTLADCVKF